MKSPTLVHTTVQVNLNRKNDTPTPYATETVNADGAKKQQNTNNIFTVLR